MCVCIFFNFFNLTNECDKFIVFELNVFPSTFCSLAIDLHNEYVDSFVTLIVVDKTGDVQFGHGETSLGTIQTRTRTIFVELDRDPLM